MLLFMFKNQAKEVAVALERISFIKLCIPQRPQDRLSDAREVLLHLAARRQILRIFTRGTDGVKDSLIALVGRVFAFQLLQQPVGFKDADVRQMPDNRTKAKTRTLMQILFARQIKKDESAGARPLHLKDELFHHLLRQLSFLSYGRLHRVSIKSMMRYHSRRTKPSGRLLAADSKFKF